MDGINEYCIQYLNKEKNEPCQDNELHNLDNNLQHFRKIRNEQDEDNWTGDSCYTEDISPKANAEDEEKYEVEIDNPAWITHMELNDTRQRILSELTTVGPMKNTNVDPTDLLVEIDYGDATKAHEINVTDGIDVCCEERDPTLQSSLNRKQFVSSHNCLTTTIASAHTLPRPSQTGKSASSQNCLTTTIASAHTLPRASQSGKSASHNSLTTTIASAHTLPRASQSGKLQGIARDFKQAFTLPFRQLKNSSMLRSSRKYTVNFTNLFRKRKTKKPYYTCEQIEGDEFIFRSPSFLKMSMGTEVDQCSSSGNSD